MTRHFKAAAFGAVLALGATAGALAQSDVKPGVYKIDPNHSQVVFSLSHFGLSNFSGMFSGAAGTLTLDPAKPEATKLDVAVDTRTVYVPVSKLTEELKSTDWFDTAKFPEAKFVATKVTPSGHDEATIDGDLTLHGVTKPVAIKAHFVGSGANPVNKAYTVGFDGRTTIKRTEFGVTKYAPYIGDSVDLVIHAAFELQQ